LTHRSSDNLFEERAIIIAHTWHNAAIRDGRRGLNDTVAVNSYLQAVSKA
jgi:hypothetical protein